MFAAIARVANSTSLDYAAEIGNETDEAENITAFYLRGPWNTSGPYQWTSIVRVNAVRTDDYFDTEEVIYPVKKESLMPMILILPLGGMLLFLSLVALVVLFRRHPAIVMIVAASTVFAAGAYNLGLTFWTSKESSYRITFDPRAPPKYE